MNEILILIYLMLIFISIGFWEAYMEGRNGWASKSVGWRLKFGKRVLTAYHFWAWIVMIPLFLILPLVISGFNLKIFGILLSGYFLGTVVEDFTWFVVNPKVKIKEFGPKYAKWHNWWNIFGLKIPDFYIIYPLIALIIWIFLVK
ncbi:MAG: hypothetical protein AABW57_00595 [Nanoarchaeota archaeon]|mgnify:FL=1